ncbi:type II CAAX prenyl endopeptidase Rce1 family protein [Spirochaetota bacterium]
MIKKITINKDILIAILSFVFVFIISFIFSIVMDLGEAESKHDPGSLLMYGRRILMIILAIAIPWILKKRTISELGWDMTVKWFLIALAVGIFMGFFNRGGFNPMSGIAIIIALFHTFSVEIFFRGYLFKTFEEGMESKWIPLVLSSFLYGLSYLTSWPIWHKPILFNIIFVGMFTLVAMPFGYGYKKSGFFWVPWLMHFFGVLKYRMLF